MKDIISSQEQHQNMKLFDAGTKKMSDPSFSNFIKLIKVQCTGSWVSPWHRWTPTLTAVLLAQLYPWYMTGISLAMVYTISDLYYLEGNTCTGLYSPLTDVVTVPRLQWSNSTSTTWQSDVEGSDGR